MIPGSLNLIMAAPTSAPPFSRSITFLADTSWVVPSDNSGSIRIKAWGGAGGGGGAGTNHAGGGSGGFVSGDILVPIGSTLVISIGGGGSASGAGGANGGGAGQGGGGAGGGGYSGVFLGTKSKANTLILAGGGGGAGGNGTASGNGTGGNNTSKLTATDFQGQNAGALLGAGGGGYKGGAASSSNAAGGGGGSGFIIASAINATNLVGNTGIYGSGATTPPPNISDPDYIPNKGYSTYRSISNSGLVVIYY